MAALSHVLTDAEVNRVNRVHHNLARTSFAAALQELQGRGSMSLFFAGNLGVDVGPNSDGVLIGDMTASAVNKCATKVLSRAVKCILDDGGAYTDDSTDANDADADDVPVLPAVPAAEDAGYIADTGGAKEFGRVDFDLTTAGDWTGTLAWEYSKGAGVWAAVSGLVDGTSAFEAAPAVCSVTFDIPEDWAADTVDGVSAKWIRWRVATYSAVTTQPLVKRIFVVVEDTVSNAAFTDATTAVNNATTNDVKVLSTRADAAIVGEGIFVGGGTKQFSKALVKYSTALTGTAVLSPYYWDGEDWQALTCVDGTVGFTAVAGTKVVSFTPPSDWAANTAGNGPNGHTGYHIAWLVETEGTMTAQPQVDQVWLYTLTDEDGGLVIRDTCNLVAVQFNAGTKSGTTADTVLLFKNVTSGAWASWVMQKGVVSARADVSAALLFTAGDKLVIEQVGEDSGTEYANVNLLLEFDNAA